MKNLKIVASPAAPKQTDVIWARQVEGGFALYFKDGRTWKPLKLIDKGEAGFADDLVIDTKSIYDNDKSSKTAFILKVNSTNPDTTTAQKNTFKATIKSGLMEIDGIFNIWSKGSIDFNFQCTTSYGNLKVVFGAKNDNLPSGEVTALGTPVYYTISIEEGTKVGSSSTVVVSDPIIVGNNSELYVSAAAAIKDILETIDADVLSAVLDTRDIFAITSESLNATDALIAKFKNLLFSEDLYPCVKDFFNYKKYGITTFRFFDGSVVSEDPLSLNSGHPELDNLEIENSLFTFRCGIDRGIMNTNNSVEFVDMQAQSNDPEYPEVGLVSWIKYLFKTMSKVIDYSFKDDLLPLIPEAGV